RNTAEIEANIAEITKVWEAYLPTVLTAQEREVANTFAAHRKKFVVEGLKPTVAALRANDLKEAQRLVVEAVRPLYVPVGAGIKALMQMQLDSSKKEYDAALERYAMFRMISLGSIVVGLAF